MSIVPSAETIRAIVDGRAPDPFAVLGMHATADGRIVVRAFRPGAEAVGVVQTSTGRLLGWLPCVDDAGFFAGALPRRKQRFDYRLRVRDAGGERDVDDAFRFPSTFGELDLHLLGEGRHWRAWELLGAHVVECGGVSGVRFGVWAPNAQRVSVVGDFNHWDGRLHPMRRHPGIGCWEIFVPGIGEGAVYKYELVGAHGGLLPLKADPFGFAGELRPQTASVVRRTDHHAWDDAEWMAGRTERQRRDAPVSIYEVHLGSWRRSPEHPERPLGYRDLADALVPYLLDMGFTHLELLPVSEHPFDGSWGYQPLGLFAPTCRHGSPEDFQYLVERCHRAGIGVILDWVPAHFPSDAHGLAQFDGTNLYEHADPRQGFHPDWNTLIYNFGRTEVVNFLVGNALFWLERYHIDGLRVDAVASMLYLDYSRKAGEWVPNRYGGNQNLEAIEFLKCANTEVYGQHPGCMTIAEESTAWPAVSQPIEAGGLGFGYKWNMGWMHDTLAYMGRDPIYRSHHHHEMTFGLLYAFSENFVLPLSHDEVVHGKGSLLARMPGDTWQQFANLRAYFGFMWAHPGKKLLFMGCEFAQGREWNFEASLDWHLLDSPWHAGVQRLVRDLNHLYRELPALHALDCEPAGFAWVSADNAAQSIYAWLRLGPDGSAPVLVVSNFTPNTHHGYRIGVPHAGRWRERLNTDAADYGGSGQGNGGGVHSEPEPMHGHPQSLAITVPPLATVVFVADL
ncbi:1,4-alpha-glucan branching protein GlgB [Plasticicumulans lactativorans]|nr:1,4-alpha-glucan branching protein GlgB [Plasticicumulans lactativorans]